MRIDHLHIQNFLGIHAIDVDLDTPVTLIAGHNGAGKSSIADALRFAFCGEAGRVRLKKEFAELVPPTAKDGRIRIDTDNAMWDVSVNGTSHRPEIPDALPYVLDAQRFAALDAKGRRQFLSNLLGVSATPETVAAMIAERGCDMTHFEQVKPLLRSGFDAAHQDCKTRATEAKGAWRQITGETWGASKGESWQPEKPDASLEALGERESALRRDLDAITDRLAKARAMATHAAQIDQWHTLVADIPALEEELETLEGKCSAQESDVQALSSAAGSGGGMLSQFTCPDCGARHRVQVSQGRVVRVPNDTADPHVDRRLTKLKSSLSETRRLLDVTKERLTKARQAKALLEEWESSDATEVVDVDALTQRRNDLQDALSAITAERERTKQQIEAGTAAKVAHETIVAWLALAEAFAPDGIPGQLLSKTIAPVNEILASSARLSGWPRAQIDAGMTITADGRRYELLSESEKWRVDAMFADAIALLSGVQLLGLDRMDVLDIPSRAQCVKWLHARAGDYDTVILMATMKAPPAGLPASFSVLWLEDGRIAAPRQEAA